MNKDFKNLGISFAISSLVDDIQFSKIEIPSKKIYVYTLNAKDNSFAYSVDIENNSNDLDSEKVLLDVLQKAYYSLTKDKNKFTFDDLSINEYIAHVLNMIKFKTKSAYDKFQNSSNIIDKLFGPKAEYLNQIDKKIVGLSETYFENCDLQTNEYDVLENMFSTFDLIFGESEIDILKLKTPISPDEIEEYYQATAEKIQQMKEYDSYLMEMYDSLDTDLTMEEFVSQMLGNIDGEVEDVENEQQDLPSFDELRNDILINKILPTIFGLSKSLFDQFNSNNANIPEQENDDKREEGEEPSEPIR